VTTLLDASSGAYRLGVRMTDVDPRRSYKVDVRVKRPGARALARTAYRPKPPASTAATAVASADRQRLRSGLDEKRSGAARQIAKPIAVALAWKGKSPARASTGRTSTSSTSGSLRRSPVPARGGRHGRLDPDRRRGGLRRGEGRDAFTEDLFLTMSGAEYSAAAGSEAVRTLTLTLPPGKWNLSVAVTDLLETHTGIARATVVAEP